MIELYKKKGETPLDALNRLRDEKPELQNETLSYAGRLDPMAEGILPILVGEEENKNRELYLKKDKEYQVEFLLGFATDTGDVLGIITEVGFKDINEGLCKKTLEELVDIKEQVYPWYSSKTVNGIALFEYARKGDFSIERPKKEIQIYEVSSIEYQKRDSQKVIESIISDIKGVQGDFRQVETIRSWDSNIIHVPDQFIILSCALKVSTGTYIRGLAEIMSQKLDVPVVVHKLVRTKIL